MKDSIKLRLLFCAALLGTACGGSAQSVNPDDPNPTLTTGGSGGNGGSGNPKLSGGTGGAQPGAQAFAQYCAWPSPPAPLWEGIGSPGALATDDVYLYWADVAGAGSDEAAQHGLYAATLAGGPPVKFAELDERVEQLIVVGDYVVYAAGRDVYKVSKKGGKTSSIPIRLFTSETFHSVQQLVSRGGELFALYGESACDDGDDTAIVRVDLEHDQVASIVETKQCITNFTVDDERVYWNSPGLIASQTLEGGALEILTKDVPNLDNDRISEIAATDEAVFLVQEQLVSMKLLSLPKAGGVPSQPLFDDEVSYFGQLQARGNRLYGIACGGVFEFLPAARELRPLATGVASVRGGNMAVTDSAVFVSGNGNIWRVEL